MDDWQEAAFTRRHVHNSSRKSKAGGGAFEVKKTFGNYEIKCSNATKTSSELGKSKRNAASPTLDVFRLSEDGKGLLGYLTLPGVLEASVILTGSRKVLEHLVSQFENEQGSEIDLDNDENKESYDRGQDGSVHDSTHQAEDHLESDDQENADESGDEHQKDNECIRFQQFEKNSFRSPKFWFQWKGQVTTSSATPDGHATETHKLDSGRGYIVFSGNDCRSFKATITCDALNWKDVSLSGWKQVSMSERDVPFAWS
ncbi:catalase [Colletotrichum graminicola]|uniref:Catalase n=1 Tax=Colletotrichum graminicola (strain M1.001 / M2 / FGSC 10212) TaxID=645133 RepID=E3Q3Z9_COLGM|nr:catalase [Colletotrichum graminicola M1.001]EFQ25751.1 catalase [Colletotrichum graminicola M1.001]WDK10892.1 catalase [Colletotrichum graminicola]